MSEKKEDMNIKLITPCENLEDKEKLFNFSQNCARVCYSEKDFEELKNEPLNAKLLDNLINSGHHSVFEHVHLTFYFDNIPKIVAMILNNEKQYVTSEKSARYTQMANLEQLQKEKYNKWMEILTENIEKIYPQISEEKRKIAIKKLAQENARYMTSVFTPTKMVHTLNLRQLNFLREEFKEFIEKYKDNGKFKKKICGYLNNFLEQTEQFDIPQLKNHTDRHLSLFNSREVEESFGDSYSTKYLMSFAGLAQAQRHRTIIYNISNEIKKDGLPFGFFVPEIITGNIKKEWLKDLLEIAKEDFPQAQLVKVNERGIIENFRSKALLRICGHAQWEIMKNTLETATGYIQYQEEYFHALKPKCLQGITCPCSCVWGGEKALERMI